MEIENSINTMELATEMTVAWLANPNTRADADEAKGFLLQMKEALDKDLAPTAEAEPAAEPVRAQGAVTVRKSLASKDHILSMIDGKPYKTLRRHLATHGMTPADYRERFGLKPDYPMVAETYSEHRRAMAHRIGLGRKPAAAAPVEAAPAPVADAPASRPKRSRTKAATAQA